MNDQVTFESVESAGAIDLVRVRGRLDARTSPRLIECCNTARARGRSLVLNLSGVTFLSSSGIGALLALTEEFREAGIELRLAETSPTVRDSVELLNLQEFLILFDQEAAAIAERAA